MSTNTLVNPAKARMQSGDIALGMPVRLGRSADIARIAKATGHDFIFIDCQHSLFNLETIGGNARKHAVPSRAPIERNQHSMQVDSISLIERADE